MYRIVLMIMILLNVKCQLAKNKVINSNPSTISRNIEIRESLKDDLFNRCKKYDSAYHIYAITLSKLDKSSIIFLRPVTYYEYLKEKGIPFTIYNYKDILFLVYSGVEDILLRNDSALVKDKYDSVCQKYNIGTIEFAYDKEPLFLKLQADTLSPFYDSDFHLLFYDRKYIKSL